MSVAAIGVYAPRLALRLLLAAAAAAMTWLPATACQAQEPGNHIRALIPGAKQVGAGRLTWFGFHAYDAALFADQGRFVENAPLALELTYAQTFRGRDIAERSISEIRKLGLVEDREAAEWLAVLVNLFPDVRAGDRLAGVAPTRGAAQFFHNGRLLGVIDNDRLKQAFFAIWLDPRTSAPDLRNRLLGAIAETR